MTSMIANCRVYQKNIDTEQCIISNSLLNDYYENNKSNLPINICLTNPITNEMVIIEDFNITLFNKYIITLTNPILKKLKMKNEQNIKVQLCQRDIIDKIQFNLLKI